MKVQDSQQMIQLPQLGQGYNHESIKNIQINKTIQHKMFKIMKILCILLLIANIAYYVVQQGYMRYLYKMDLLPRALLQQPQKREYQAVMWTITSKQIPKNTNCMLMNSVNIITSNTVKNIVTILQQSQSIDKIVMFSDVHDLYGNRLMRKLQQQNKKLIITKKNIQFQGSFQFLGDIKQNCQKISYMFSNFYINKQMIKNIDKNVIKLPQNLLIHSSKYVNPDNQSIITYLPNLQLYNFTQTPNPPQLLYSYIYIFHSSYLNLNQPTNFAYYAKYTIQQMILVPLLLIYQSTSKLTITDLAMHGLISHTDKSVVFAQFKQYSIKNIQTNDNKNTICIVSYPQNPYQIDTQNLNRYIQSIKSQQFKTKITSRVFLIIYLPYNYHKQSKDDSLFQLLQKILSIHKQQRYSWLTIKIKFKDRKASSSLAVYQSAYDFGPFHSMMVSSRHNVVFKNNMVQQVMKAVSVRYHYYVFDLQQNAQNQDEKVKIIDFDDISSYNKQFKKRNGKVFQQKLRHVQVYKSDFLRMIPFSILKSSQIDFYNTQASFVIHLMQIIRLNIKHIPKVLASFTPLKSNIIKNQQATIDNIKMYTEYPPILFNFLAPYLHNSLQNQAYRRNAPYKIPAIIHQSWISYVPISDLRQRLHNSLRQTNPGFQFKLWKLQDITKQNFPLTFALLRLVSQKSKTSKISLFAMVADIMRNQIVFQHGGIYIDFKFEGRKSLDNFRKYQQFFIDFDRDSLYRTGRPKPLGAGVFGATKNNYYLNCMINDAISKYYPMPFVTGSFVVRKVFSDYEFLTQLGYGYHLFVPRSYEQVKQFCGGVNREYEAQKQIFYVDHGSLGRIKLGFPCTVYPEAYIIIYSPLMGTWLGNIKN